MALGRTLSNLWKSLFRSSRLDHELDEELQQYLEDLVAKKIREGRNPVAARRDALLQMGGLTQIKYNVRDQRPGVFIESVAKDMVYAARSLRRNVGLLLAITITLALGIGANTAVYSIVHAILIQPPLYRAPERLAFIYANMVVGGIPRGTLSGPEVVDFQKTSTAFKSLAAIQAASVALTGQGDPEQLRLARVTWNFFEVLGVDMARGRSFSSEDGQPSQAASVVVSWSLFERRFGGDSNAIGRELTLNGRPAILIGVLPRHFRLNFREDLRIPDDLQVFQPFQADLSQGNRLLRYYRMVGRLADGVPMADASREVEAISADLARRFPAYVTAKHSFYTAPLLSDNTRTVRPMLLALLAGVVVVLIVSCVNVAGLLLARTAARRREIATLIAIGADRARLFRQFVVEGLLIAAIGAVAGLATGFAALRGIAALRPPGLDRLRDVSIDGPVLAVIAAVACVWGLLFALTPWLEVSRANLPAARVRNRARSALVVVQIALGTSLIVTAGLLVRTVDALHHVDAGFDLSTQALTFRVALPPERYPDSARVNAFNRELEARLKTLPGVRDVGAISQLPFDDSGNWASKYFAEQSDQNLATARFADTRAVTPGLLRVLGIQLVEGRWFSEDDDRDHSLVAIVDEQLAARAWPNAQAVGQRLHLPFLLDRQVVTGWATVVGVVHHLRHRTLDADVQEQVYLPYRQNLQDPVSYVIRTGADSVSLAPEVRRTVSGLDPLLPAFNIQPFAASVERASSSRKFTAMLFSSFALLALVLSGVGLGGLIGYSVTSRRREFGIRLSLGATPRRVQAKVLGEAFALIGAGLSLGLAGGAAAAQGIRSLLFGVGPADMMSYAGALGLLLLTGFAASWWPARRAMRVNPAETLRSE